MLFFQKYTMSVDSWFVYQLLWYSGALFWQWSTLLVRWVFFPLGFSIYGCKSWLYLSQKLFIQLLAYWLTPFQWPQANKNEGGKRGKYGLLWPIVVVQSNKKVGLSWVESPKPCCSNFLILLDQHQFARDCRCRADFNKINVVASPQ